MLAKELISSHKGCHGAGPAIHVGTAKITRGGD